MAAGSEAALELIYDRYASAIFAAAYRLTADRGTAEEVVQETFLALWNRAESFDAAVGSLAAWLHTIARNRAIDRLRAAGRRPSLVALSSAAGSDEDHTQALERLVSGGTVIAGAEPPASPEAAFDAAGRHETIRGALAEMSEVERTVILLAYQEELWQPATIDGGAILLANKTIQFCTARAVAPGEPIRKSSEHERPIGPFSAIEKGCPPGLEGHLA